MAFGVKREELEAWKRQVAAGHIAFLTHYWVHPRYPGITSVTKAGCSDVARLRLWAVSRGLPPHHIHQRERYPHYDLLGSVQERILREEQLWDQLHRFVINRPVRPPGPAAPNSSRP